MSQKHKPPVPLPRRQISLPDKTEDKEPLKCCSAPQSPTKSPEGGLVRPAPPAVLPKKVIVKKSPGGSETVNGRLEIVKVIAEQSVDNNCKVRPPRLPPKLPKQEPDNENEILDVTSLLEWWKAKKSWDSLCEDLRSPVRSETRIIIIKAKQLYKAVQIYILLLSQHIDTLRKHTSELLSIADNLDKVSKGTKIAGITGGATTVAGGVAAAAGVILSPLTMGASLALTAVGVGVAAAGGVTGASAAIANKVNVSQDKKKIDNIFQEYDKVMSEIMDCLIFVSEGIEKLKQHDLSVLSEARKSSVRVAGVVELATTGGAGAMAIEATSKASGLIEGFALGMDFYFTKGKDGPKLKKGLESKFARKIRKLAEEVNTGLNELEQMKDLVSKL